MTGDTARDDILAKVRAALDAAQRKPGEAAPVPPPSTRLGPRVAGDRGEEIALLLGEIEKLGGVTRRIVGEEALAGALDGLVRSEEIRRAALWTTTDLAALGIASLLVRLGVSVVPSNATEREIAECDLGVTGVDAALPETGTLLLRSSPERPRLVSLLPRVHLAIIPPAALRADLHDALGEVKGEGYAVLVTGPSRTADIELTVAIGMHGPKALYAWVVT